MTTARHTPWIDRLASALHGRAHVALRTPDGAWTGDDLWRGARAWARALHARGLVPGDRIACALPAGPALVTLLLASLAEGFTLAPLPPGTDLDAAGLALDARAIAGDAPTSIVDRAARGAPTPHVRLLLRTSGTTGTPRWLALSDDNLCAVLDGHAPHLARAGATVLSVLPWHHAFGLVMQLLPALRARAALVRESSGGRDPAAILAAAAAHGVTHLDAVPHTLRRLVRLPGGRALLARLRGGVVGGAPVDAPLAAVLAGTRLRVGYGQTEAAPGIALGAPGEWRAGILGRGRWAARCVWSRTACSPSVVRTRAWASGATGRCTRSRPGAGSAPATWCGATPTARWCSRGAWPTASSWPTGATWPRRRSRRRCVRASRRCARRCCRRRTGTRCCWRSPPTGRRPTPRR